MRPLTLRFTRRARRHIEAIYGYLVMRNPEAAVRVIARIRESTELLREFPMIGSDDRP